MCGLIAFLLIISGLWGFGSSFQSAQSVIVPPELTAEAVLVSTPEDIPQVDSIPQIDMPQLISCKGQPLEQDITEIESIVGNTFSGDDWDESISTNEYRTYVTWTNASRGGLAFLDYQHYDCGVTQAQIDAYFSEDNFDILLSNYQSFDQTAACASGGMNLYEFDVVTIEGYDYMMRWWYWQETPTRVASMQMTFPITQQAALAEYAGDLFPDFPTCTPAAG